MTTAHDRPKIGEPAPNIALEWADGSIWQLAEQGGRNVVLIFHRHIH